MFLKSQKPLVFAVVCGSHSAHSLKLRDNACSAVFECLPYAGGERYHLESRKILATVIASVRKNTWQTTILVYPTRLFATLALLARNDVGIFRDLTCFFGGAT